MPVEQTCPDVSRWQMLLAEDLSQPEQQSLEDHLDICERCQGVVEVLAIGNPCWTAAVRQLAHAGAADEPAMHRVLRDLKHGGLPLTERMEPEHSEEAHPAPPVLTFLAPPRETGHLGELGQYSIHEVIGQGGMGIVLKGYDNVLTRFVALKVLATPLVSQGVHRQRFLREARAAAAVVHEHVVTIHAVEEGGDFPYIVMQYVKGCSLQERVKRNGPLELREILRIGMQIASGLAAAHAQGLIHRDIKPANILLENSVERVKITDFGLARTINDSGLTQSGIVSGTPQYMAPEQARGEPLDHRADLFSLGSVLYFMCTGKSPFHARSLIAVIRSVSDSEPHPLRHLNPDTPDWLVEIIARLHAKSPRDRYQTAAEVADLLSAHLARLQNPLGVSLLSEHDADDVAAPTLSHVARRRPLRRTMVSAALLLIGALGLAITEATGVTHLAGFFAATSPGGAPRSIAGVAGTTVPQSSKPNAPTPSYDDPTRVTLHDLSGMDSGEIGSFAEKPKWIVTAALSPDGRHALSAGGADTALLLWDVKEGRLVHRLVGHNSPLRSVTFSPDGHRALSGGGGSWQVVNGERPGGEDFSVRLWDIEKLQEIKAFRGHTLGVTGVAFTPEGDRVLSCSRDTTVRLWSIETGMEIRRYPGHPAEALCIAVSSQGDRVVVGGWDVALLWDIETGTLLKRLEGHTGPVVAAAFSPDGQKIATAGHDGTVRISSVETGQELHKFSGHKGRVLGVAFSPDGRRILSAGDDKILRLWNAETADEIKSFSGHTNTINGVAFAPHDDRMAISAGEDGTMRVWLLPAK